MASEPNIESTDEFRGEYELALETWLRRRFSGLCATLFAIEALGIAGWVLMLVTTSPSDEPTPDDSTISPFIALMLLSAGVLGWFYYRVVPKLEARKEIIHAASTMIVALGMIDLVAMMMPDVGANGLLGIYFIHLVSSLFLPWSPGDSLRPMVPLLGTWLVIKLITATATGPALLGLEIVASPLGFLPGIAVCAVRMWHWRRRFQTAAMARGFGVLRREVKQARRIHESLFPEPFSGPGFAFEFEFQPMRDLGGDYVHASTTPQERIRVVLIDVTGHGLSAAMTVTRLSGELERVVAEQPDIGPGAILVALNRYAHLVLSQHSIFATAIAAELDPSDGTIRTANAGHPPAMIRRIDGDVELLDAHGILLGAVGPEDFECTETRSDLADSELVLLYTDGVTEVRNRNGRFFGVENLTEAMRRKPAPKSWVRFITSIVDGHRVGPPEDDVLVASLTYRGTDGGPDEGSETS
ncbi:MAG: serine/threonine-protein phosphatase [Phycisphaera sp.]|nr:serine/threonine-protein phosphatase [Phycisphaera sp.]